MSRRERKVVTVLFVDLVGFTSRAERLDPEDVEAILRPYHDQLRNELERHGGTVEKFIGDAVMAVFGAPLAHDDDPERALRAALAIRDAMADVGTDIRIGVNTGEALVTVGADPSAGEAMVAGDVVNTASRIQAAAAAGAIYVGETTYRATERTIVYGEPQSIDAKGKSGPVRVWEALEARSRVELDARAPRSPLVGRQRELNILVDALARVRAEESAQLVTLVGEPGIGKSRLTHELFQMIEADRELIWWRHGRSLPYGEGVSLWALGEIVRNHAGILANDPPSTAEEKLHAAVAGMPDADWIEQHLRPLVGLGGKVDMSSDRRGEAFVAWRRFFEALADIRPLVLVFEDLQWADDALLDFVDQLADWVSGVPVLIVATARPELLERRAGWGGGKRNSTTLSLSPLTEVETEQIITNLVPNAPAAVLARAGGNPLYAEEFALMLAQRGTDAEMPDSVQGVIAARLDGLDPADKTLLQHAAVFGRVFWLGAIQAVDGSPSSELETRLHPLTRMGFVRRDRRASIEGDIEFSFVHVLLRDVAYGQIPRAERAELHQRAARWIESLENHAGAAEMLAHHYARAIEYLAAAGQDSTALAPAARLAFAEAGDRSFGLCAYKAARAFYSRALALWPGDAPERNRLVVQTAHCIFLDNRSDFAALDAMYEELLSTGDRASAAEVGALASWTAWSRGEHGRALSTLRDSVAALEHEPASRAKAVVMHELARVSTLGGNPDAVARATEALAAATEAGERDLMARSMNTLGLARMDEGDTAGIEDLRRSLELAKEAQSPLDICRAYINLGATTSNLGELQAAYQLHLEGSEVARRFELGPQTRWFSAEQCDFDYAAGRWDDVLKGTESFLAEVAAGSPHYLADHMHSMRALILLAQGRDAAALDEVAMMESGSVVSDPQALIPRSAEAAFVYQQAGRRDEAAVRFDRLLGLCEASLLGIYWMVPEMAFVAAGLGREADVLALVGRSHITPWVEASTAFLRGDYVEAAEAFNRIGSRPHEAYVRLHGPIEDIERAMEFYRSVQATHFLTIGEERLLGA
jgi:class 3 adenylate cyclase/tetratricopeptide (TPR) repeat protein